MGTGEYAAMNANVCDRCKKLINYNITFVDGKEDLSSKCDTCISVIGYINTSYWKSHRDSEHMDLKTIKDPIYCSIDCLVEDVKEMLRDCGSDVETHMEKKNESSIT